MGSPGMLGSDALRNHVIWFLPETPGIVERVAQHYDVLLNAVDVRNVAHTRWLRFAGFALPTVMRRLGHRSIQMTMRYAHRAPSNLREAAAVLEAAE